MDAEKKVRKALHRAAAQVQPAPDGWERLEEARRAGRRRDRVVGAASALAVLALLGATLVVMRPDGVRTELTSPSPASPPSASVTAPAELPQPATPETAPAPAAAEDHLALLATTGGGQVLVGLPAGAVEEDAAAERSLEAVCQRDCAPEVLRVRPGSRVGDITAVRAANGRCEILRNREVVAEAEGGCESPVWSPDGDRLAWLDRSGDPTVVETRIWSEATHELRLHDVPGEIPAFLESPYAMELEAWPGAQPERSSREILAVASDVRGSPVAASIELPARRDDSDLASIAVAVADKPHFVIARDDDGATWVVIDAVLTDGRVESVTLQGSGESLNLPPDLSDPRAVGPANVWVALAGRDVLVGDGVDQVWWTRLTGDGFAPLQEILPGAYAITAGDLVRPGLSTTEPSPPVETSPTATPTMEEISPREAEVGVFFGVAGPSCEEVERFPRLVDSPAVARGALEALLAGPTAEEAAAGAFFGLPPQPPRTVRSARIEDGTAHVDFGPLQRSASGAETTSCGSAQLLASLDATLTQFPTIDRARYSIEGSEEAFYAFAGERVPPP